MEILGAVVLGIFVFWNAWVWLYVKTQYPLDKRLYDVTRR